MRKASELLTVIDERIQNSKDMGSIQFKRAVSGFIKELNEDLDTGYEEPADNTEAAMKILDDVINEEAEEPLDIEVDLEDDEENDDDIYDDDETKKEVDEEEEE